MVFREEGVERSAVNIWRCCVENEVIGLYQFLSLHV